MNSSCEIQFPNWLCELSFPSSSGFHLYESQLFGSYAGEMECLQDQRLHFQCNYFMLHCIKDIQISWRLFPLFDTNSPFLQLHRIWKYRAKLKLSSAWHFYSRKLFYFMCFLKVFFNLTLQVSNPKNYKISRRNCWESRLKFRVSNYSEYLILLNNMLQKNRYHTEFPDIIYYLQKWLFMPM